MLFSAAVVFSTLTSVFANNYAGISTSQTGTLYARAQVANPNLGIDFLFEFWGTKDGEPTYVKVKGKGLTNSPSLGGPHPYHIHTNPVPADGNCTKTLAHLDSLNVTEGFVCDPAFPQYCQNGDLSGKHGKLNATDDGKIAAFGYSDAFVRFFPESHSILGRSIVIHSANKTRLACGNIISHLDGTADSKGRPTHKPSNYVKNYPASAPVPPGPPIIPFNGTTMTDPSVIATFPYPLPMPALRLDEALNVQLTTITHSVKYANTEQTITQAVEKKVDGSGPFRSKGDQCV